MYEEYLNCKICPRECGANRYEKAGACGAGAEMRISEIMLHRFEEPPVSGTHGSGAIFFAGCNLRCGYCQNREISHAANAGRRYSAESLAAAMLELQAKNAHNINLVTAGHFLPQVIDALKAAKKDLRIPVVYNSSAYEKVESLARLEGLVDVYLPDFKYISSDPAKRYSAAADYPQVAADAIAEMLRQTGEYTEKDGIAVRGTIIRHLVLPSLSRDGEQIMRFIAERFPAARVSVMSQYTPSFNRTGDRTFDRKVTSFEYARVLGAAAEAGLQGFSQARSSASSEYTPDFRRKNESPSL